MGICVTFSNLRLFQEFLFTSVLLFINFSFTFHCLNYKLLHFGIRTGFLILWGIIFSYSTMFDIVDKMSYLKIHSRLDCPCGSLGFEMSKKMIGDEAQRYTFTETVLTLGYLEEFLKMG